MNPACPPSNRPGLTADLQTHLALCEEALGLVTRENQALHSPAPFAGDDFARQRAALLPRLTESLEALRRTREAWQQLDPATRARQNGVDHLLRDNQNLIMKVIVLDRENEQALLRRGLLSPAHLPSSQCQRPHTVAAHYVKNLPA